MRAPAFVHRPQRSAQELSRSPAHTLIRKKLRWDQFTTELIDLLHVLTLVRDTEDEQSDLIERILGGPLLSAADLEAAGVFPAPKQARKPPSERNTSSEPLFD